MLLLLLLVALYGCTDGSGGNQATPTPVLSLTSLTSPAFPATLISQPPPASLRTALSPPPPVPSPVLSFPTITSVPTIDPAAPNLPTDTPGPTYTPHPTSTPCPPAPPPPPLTLSLPDPHEAGVQHFPQTGHTLQGVFLDYWNKHGGLPEFGYPITEAFVEAVGPDNEPLQVQYFERRRFELHSENAGTPAEVRAGLQGTEEATQKGYFVGKYPRYGHAADFSWVSGVMQDHWPPNCMTPWCGCSILRFEGKETRDAERLSRDHKVQLEGMSWRNYEVACYPFPSGGTLFVAFGHLARPDEEQNKCTFYVHPQEYIVDSVYMNAVPNAVP